MAAQLSDGITTRCDIKVELVQSVGSDVEIAASARVMDAPSHRIERRTVEASAGGLHARDIGIIDTMMKSRHGTPFEHNSLTFYVECPIFVAREWFRHRIGWGYNEWSGRYKHLQPIFWVPAPHRAVIEPDGFKPMRPELESNTVKQDVCCESLAVSYQWAWESYKQLIQLGIAREVARVVLPVGIYTSFWATCNMRSLMAFLSLRTKDERSRFPSYPMAEIDDAARQMEALAATLFPYTVKAFNEHGRVSP